jgi:hypothetical protein
MIAKGEVFLYQGFGGEVMVPLQKYGLLAFSNYCISPNGLHLKKLLK